MAVDVYTVHSGAGAAAFADFVRDEIGPGFIVHTHTLRSTGDLPRTVLSRRSPLQAILAVVGDGRPSGEPSIDDIASVCRAGGDPCIVVILGTRSDIDTVKGVPRLHIGGETEVDRREVLSRLRAAFAEGMAAEPDQLLPAHWVDDGDSEVLPGTTLTRDAAAVLARARQVNHTFESVVDVSFSSLLISFLLGTDGTSDWFRRYLDGSAVSLDAVLRQRSLSSDSLRDLGRRILVPSDLEASQHLSFSARRLASAARDFAARTGESKGAPVAVRHLIGAFLYDGAGHDRDFEKLNFARDRWSRAFVSHVAREAPPELAAWRVLHETRFPTSPLGMLDTEGPTTRLATDRWTTVDSLGYSSYARAIVTFLRHKETEPPLTIGVHAPWGGGKTSLMRMIQRDLDPEHPSLSGEAQTTEAAVAATVGDVDRELDTLGRGTEDALRVDREIVTVWFNPWAYETTNEVWAGLATALIDQLSARLGPVDRERFLIRLNLRRVSATKIRRRIHEKIFQTLVSRAWGLVTALILASVAGAVLLVAGSADAMIPGLAAGSLGLAGLSAKLADAIRSVRAEPAHLALADIVDVPDYDKMTNFVRHVDVDIRRVLGLLPADRLVVIFIDDLDRCSPAKVAQVMEAVNLFLAGEFGRCAFVVGMDPEVVAASLQSAYHNLIADLPPEVGAQMGWRFMGKFIQLPFLLPPVAAPDLKRYADRLLAMGPLQQVSIEERQAAVSMTQRQIGLASREAPAEAWGTGSPGPPPLMPSGDSLLSYMEEGTKLFDKGVSAELQRLVREEAIRFSRNPRELKRFVNALRFQYFLSWARRCQTGHTVTLEQLTRWVVFTLGWPEVVSWVWRDTPFAVQRLASLEQLAAQATDFEAWKALAPEVLSIEVESTHWSRDRGIYRFFRTESKLAENERLSAAMTEGLW